MDGIVKALLIGLCLVSMGISIAGLAGSTGWLFEMGLYQTTGLLVVVMIFVQREKNKAKSTSTD